MVTTRRPGTVSPAEGNPSLPVRGWDVAPVTKDGFAFAFVEAFSMWDGDYNLARMVADFHTLTFIGSLSQNVDIYISWTFEGRGGMTMSMPNPG
jgi:hypothetical protein